MKIHRLLLGLSLLTAVEARAQFNYITNNGGAIITGYTGGGGALAIPATLGGVPVVTIQGSEFQNQGLTSVSIPASLTNIQAQAFAPNNGLTTFTVDSSNAVYSAVGGVLFNKTGTMLVEYPPGISGSYTIPTNVTAVGPSAFAACYFLSGVTIPNGVTNIGSQGFGFCFALTNITIPTNVTSIGPDAFINCTNLTAIMVAAGNPAFASVGGVLFDKTQTTLVAFPTALKGSYAIPNGVTNIGTDAFILCNGLTNVTMPSTVTTLSYGAFADCLGLTNITLGAGVSSISMAAFGGCTQLAAISVNSSNLNFSSLGGVVLNKNQTVLLLAPPGLSGSYTTPNTVTNIADYAFEDTLVSAVTISSNVFIVGIGAFQGCGNLTNVTIAPGVVSIRQVAFGNCSKLTTVTIPATVGYLPGAVFAYCGLTAVYFQGNAPAADPQAFLGDSGTVYYLAGTSGWGPTFDGLPTVMTGAPHPNGALQVTILPNNGALALAQWQVDGGVPQYSGATVVGLSVGSHTVSFTPVSGWITPSNLLLSVSANATSTASGTYTQQTAPATDFSYVTNAGSITIIGYRGSGGTVLIPPTISGLPVTAIAASAFSSVSSLVGVTIPDSVTNLGNFAFSGCSALVDVTVSAGVTVIGIGTFENCASLSVVTLRGAVTSIQDDALASCPALFSFAIPATVTNLGTYSFFGDGLTAVTIPASVTSIGTAAFMYCNQLPAIQVDPANPAYASVAGVLFNKNKTTLIEYPDGNLAASYVISNGVTSISDSAFEYCKLSSVTIASSVASIGNYAFESCMSLTGLIIPNGVTTIGNDAFAQCNGLTSINLPASVINLGQVPFANCNNMTSITVAAGNPAFSSVGGVLYNKGGTMLVEFPCGLTGSFTVPAGVQDIGGQAFEQCQLSRVVIPGSVTNIELDAFFNCLNLGSVTLNQGLTAIGVAAFQNCYFLTNVVLPASLASIGVSAFSGCNALTTMVIPSGVRVLGDYAFAFDPALTAAYFEGNAPPDDATVFVNDSTTTVYYLPGATGWGTTFGSAPARVLAGIALTANPTKGAVPLTVGFTAASVDGATNPVANWNWNFGDGSTSAAQNPSHIYTAFGNFTAAVVETNSAGVPIAGGAVSITAIPVPVYLGLVENGGFETGDFTGWNLFGGDPLDNFVTNAVNGVSAREGSYFAVLGSSGASLSYLSQTLTTIAGKQYQLSFWLNSPDGLGTNQFLVSWNGTNVFNQTNLPATGWTNLQFIVAATTTNTVLQFGFRDDPSFLGLDDISVNLERPGIAGLTMSGANLVLHGVNGQSGKTYVVLTSTNAAAPLSQWTPVVTNLLNANGTFSITVSNTFSAQVPRRFYILQTQ